MASQDQTSKPPAAQASAELKTTTNALGQSILLNPQGETLVVNQKSQVVTLKPGETVTNLQGQPVVGQAATPINTGNAEPTSSFIASASAITGASLETPLPTVTSDSSNSTQGGSGSDGLQAGAVAGVAIGMLFAGFLIAGLIFFFLLRRQKKQQQGSFTVNHVPPTHHVSRPEKSSVAELFAPGPEKSSVAELFAPGPKKSSVAVTTTASNNIDNYLPQPVSDDTLTDDISKIRDNIKNHIRTFYHSNPVNSSINEAALSNVAAATGTSTTKLLTALTNPSTRPEVLRLVMAWVIMSKTTGPQNATLLPPALSTLTSAFADCGSTTAGLVLYSKWKTITGALLSRHPDKSLQNAHRAQVSASVIQELDAIVSPFVRGDVDPAQRSKNLDMIITRAAGFATLLFSQPGAFEFDFGSTKGGLCVFPAFVQRGDDEGTAMRTPRVLFEAEVVGI